MLRGFLATSGARRASALAVAVVLLLAGAAARADVIQIDPRNPPPTALDPAEDAKLRALMNVSFVPLLSDVSPDDGVVLSVAPSVGPALLDVHSRATTAVSPALFGHRWLTELRWRDARTLVTVAASLDAGTLHLLTVARDGSVTAPPLALGDGIPISLGPGGRRLLVARLSEAARRREPSRVSPFDIEPRQPSFPRVGPAVSDLDARQSIRVARAEARLAVVDLDSGREWPLAAVPLGVGLVDVAWAADETKLSLITAVAPDFRRGGVVQPDSATVLDGLGRLAPADNPFFVTNAFHIYDLGGAQATHRELRPRAGEREVFYSAHWSGSGGTLLVQMMSPSHPKGRTHPSYANLHGARYRLYTSAGVLRRSFSRPEIGSVTSPQFVSPADVVFLSPHRLDWNLYHLNLTTGSFRRLPTPPGSIFQVRATRRSRELVYNHASFLAPYEAYRIGLRDGAPHTLTAFNAAAARASQVQVRRLTFALRSGPREGYLIQPKGAAFPPRNAPLVVWQEGGPTGTMTNSWGSFAELPFNILPNFGFSMLMVPLQGRYGHGVASLDALADDRNFGQIDIDDQAEIVRQLVRRGYTSHDRLGITGCSYGGYFSSQSVTSHRELYAAANPQCSLLDLLHEWSFGYMGYISYLEGRTPSEDEAEYRRDSPVHNAAAVKTPTLLFAGTEDFLPWQISGAFHDGIAAAGTPARFLVFEGEPHGLRQRSSERVALEAQLLWFRQYLDRN